MQFPKDFLWGTATSSYQIEGAVNEDGKGKSIWDVFTHVPGTVKDRSNGDVAIDHYHRFREDIRLMAKMGIRNYRFSISWGRILPDGTGAVNEKGLAFYSELVDCLLENGIRPFCTLYHWDLPYALHLRGGWLSPDMPEWFANYTTIIADALGDRVKDFITINEPQCIIGSGYALGVHAPGLKCCAADIVRAAHHLMLAHGRAVQVLRAHVPGVRVGYAPCGDPCVPYTNSPEDIAAARKEYFTVHIDEKVGPAWNIAWFSDPVMLGQYPADGLVGYEQYLPDGWQEDLKTIHQPLDFYGQNIYQGQWWRRGADGKVHDPNRQDYMHRYLRALGQAVADGVPVLGYFYWSFFDNFEWAHGYQERFGLVYVNYQTQERILKDSAYWYQQVMATNGENL